MHEAAGGAAVLLPHNFRRTSTIALSELSRTPASQEGTWDRPWLPVAVSGGGA
jgi:hypothetical protein